MSGVVAFAGSRSSVSPLVPPAVRSVLVSGQDIVVGCARGTDEAVAATVCGWGLGQRLGIFAVAPAPDGSWAAAAARDGAVVAWGVAGAASGRAALARRSRLVLAAAVAGGPGSGLVAFPSTPCPAVCRPVAGPVFSGRVSGGGSGSWLAVALAVGAGLPVALFLPAGVAAPAWSGGSWVAAASSGVWASALLWSPSVLFGIPSGPGRLPAPWVVSAGEPSGSPFFWGADSTYGRDLAASATGDWLSAIGFPRSCRLAVLVSTSRHLDSSTRPITHHPHLEKTPARPDRGSTR